MNDETLHEIYHTFEWRRVLKQVYKSHNLISWLDVENLWLRLDVMTKTHLVYTMSIVLFRKWYLKRFVPIFMPAFNNQPHDIQMSNIKWRILSFFVCKVNNCKTWMSETKKVFFPESKFKNSIIYVNLPATTFSLGFINCIWFVVIKCLRSKSMTESQEIFE